MPDQIRDAAEAVKGIVEAVPVYEDAVQPAAREIGKALETVAKTVNVALAPVSLVVWGFDRIKEYLDAALSEKLKHVPPEEIVEPKLLVAGPAVEALRFVRDEETLRDMYANLLATAMDRQTAEEAHPSFVEILTQLSPDEARLVRYFAVTPLLPYLNVKEQIKAKPNTWAGYYQYIANFYTAAEIEHSSLYASYLLNLRRLGLVDLPDHFYTDDAVYEPLEATPRVVSLIASINANEETLGQIERRRVEITSFGSQFMRACVLDQTEARGAKRAQDVSEESDDDASSDDL